MSYVSSSYPRSYDEYIAASEGTTKPHFTIESIPSSINAQVGETFDICAKIKNDGTASGTYKAELYNEQETIVDQAEQTLNAGKDVEQCLHDSRSQAGTYTYTYKVYNEATETYDDQATVTVNVTSAPPPTTSTANTSKMGFGWILLIILLLIILGGRKK